MKRYRASAALRLNGDAEFPGYEPAARRGVVLRRRVDAALYCGACSEAITRDARWLLVDGVPYHMSCRRISDLIRPRRD